MSDTLEQMSRRKRRHLRRFVREKFIENKEPSGSKGSLLDIGNTSEFESSWYSHNLSRNTKRIVIPGLLLGAVMFGDDIINHLTQKNDPTAPPLNNVDNVASVLIDDVKTIAAATAGAVSSTQSTLNSLKSSYDASKSPALVATDQQQVEQPKQQQQQQPLNQCAQIETLFSNFNAQRDSGVTVSYAQLETIRDCAKSKLLLRATNSARVNSCLAVGNDFASAIESTGFFDGNRTLKIGASTASNMNNCVTSKQQQQPTQQQQRQVLENLF